MKTIFLLLLACNAISAYIIHVPPKDGRAWPGECSTGSRQSPISLNFTFNDAHYARERDMLVNEEYVNPQEFQVENHGYTARVSLPSSVRPTITGKFLGDRTYVFAQAHFHWGAQARRGSEHTLNGQMYDMEAHLVHHDSKFRNAQEAIYSGERWALAVVAIFFKISDRENPNLSALTEALQRVRNAGETRRGFGLSISELYPSNDFFNLQYRGSLTTPDCQEVVLWNVLEQRNYISLEQMNRFRELLNDEGKPISGNVRPIQPTNGREVAYYKIQIVTE